MHKDQSLDKPMCDLCVALDELMVAGNTLSGLDYSLWTLGLLPPCWQTFVSTITGCLYCTKPDEIMFYASDLLATVMDKEQRLLSELTNNPETSLYAQNIYKSKIK